MKERDLIEKITGKQIRIIEVSGIQFVPRTELIQALGYTARSSLSGIHRVLIKYGILFDGVYANHACFTTVNVTNMSGVKRATVCYNGLAIMEICKRSRKAGAKQFVEMMTAQRPVGTGEFNFPTQTQEEPMKYEVKTNSFQGQDIKSVEIHGVLFTPRSEVTKALGYTSDSQIKRIHKGLIEEGVLIEVKRPDLGHLEVHQNKALFIRVAIDSNYPSVCYNSETITQICFASGTDRAKEFKAWAASQLHTSVESGELVASNKISDEMSEVLAANPILAQMIELAVTQHKQTQEMAAMKEENALLVERVSHIEQKVHRDEGGYTAIKAAQFLGWKTESSGAWCAPAVVKALKFFRLDKKGLAWLEMDYTGKEAWYLNQQGLNYLFDQYAAKATGDLFVVEYNRRRNFVRQV